MQRMQRLQRLREAGVLVLPKFTSSGAVRQGAGGGCSPWLSRRLLPTRATNTNPASKAGHVREGGGVFRRAGGLGIPVRSLPLSTSGVERWIHARPIPLTPYHPRLTVRTMARTLAALPAAVMIGLTASSVMN